MDILKWLLYTWIVARVIGEFRNERHATGLLTMNPPPWKMFSTMRKFMDSVVLSRPGDILYWREVQRGLQGRYIGDGGAGVQLEAGWQKSVSSTATQLRPKKTNTSEREQRQKPVRGLCDAVGPTRLPGSVGNVAVAERSRRPVLPSSNFTCHVLCSGKSVCT